VASRYPRICIAGTASGAGKTTVTLGVMAALRARGYEVQGFKVGPDYIDPGFHALVTGRPGRTLDLWLVGARRLAALFAHGMAGADIAVVEGVMGLYDGIGNSSAGSTADIAKRLRTPVILVVDVRGMGRTAAALVDGYRRFDAAVPLAGAILARVGSRRHFNLVKEAVEKHARVPVLGYLAFDPALSLPERHLGLVPACEQPDHSRFFDRLREAVEAGINVDALLEIASGVQELPATENPLAAGRVGDASIAVARDEAFHFYYPENLELLVSLGARLKFFSPLRDRHLPPGTQGIYIGGGFPEVFAAELAANTSLKQEIRAAAEAGVPVVAECGGYMYLCRGIGSGDAVHPMVGLIPATAVITKRLQRCGYVRAEVLKDCPLGRRGAMLRGHAFHYSVLQPEGSWPYAFRSRTFDGGKAFEGVAAKNLLASYIHFHLAGHPAAAKRFLAFCQGQKAWS